MSSGIDAAAARAGGGIQRAPRYLAMYDLANPEVLSSPAYMKVGFGNASPWTKRVTSRVRIYRSFGQQVYPGTRLTTRAARVLLLRFRGLPATTQDAIVAGMRKSFESRPETLQVRVFAYDTGAGVDFLGFVETREPFSGPLNLEAFGDCRNTIDLVNTYAPYT
jgi:hypothetical protein